MTKVLAGFVFLHTMEKERKGKNETVWPDEFFQKTV
jgi:hypothetical protein